MLKELYQKIENEEDLRNNLILLKKELKNEINKKVFLQMIDGRADLLVKLLNHDEPKVRKNTALILGQLKLSETLEPLFTAYEQEKQLFIRSDYLKAMSAFDYSNKLEKLEERLSQLLNAPIKEEEKKHIREEISLLQKMVLKDKKGNRHEFVGKDNTYEVLLITNPMFRELTAKQIKGKEIFLLPMGVKTVTDDIDQIRGIRTCSELLFLIKCKEKLSGNPIQIAKALRESNLLEIIHRAHGDHQPVYFRLGVVSKMPLDKRSQFVKRCSCELEERSARNLINAPSNYEIEIRLYEKKDGTFFPALKFFTLKDERFQYRENVTPVSIAPHTAAIIAQLSQPFLKEDAQVLDPFCGVGTMLMERDHMVAAKVMYGIDIYNEAVKKAKLNTDLAGRQVYYINRDFFTFSHQYLFDEIFTNLPDRGKKGREEQDNFYRKFFEKSKDILKTDGIIIMYTDEHGLVKKYLRLMDEFTLKKEYCLNEKESKYLFIIGQRRQA